MKTSSKSIVMLLEKYKMEMASIFNQWEDHYNTIHAPEKYERNTIDIEDVLKLVITGAMPRPIKKNMWSAIKTGGKEIRLYWYLKRPEKADWRTPEQIRIDNTKIQRERKEKEIQKFEQERKASETKWLKDNPGKNLEDRKKEQDVKVKGMIDKVLERVR